MEPFIETNAAPLIINEFNPNNISRCLSCNLIPLINITYEKNNPIISYECPNKHNGNKNINEFIKLSKNHSIFNEKCGECNKNQEIKDNIFSYCSKCNKFICEKCFNKHRDNKHMLIDGDRFDSICIKHSNTFSSYCINCKRNLCIYCVNEHENHKKVYLSNIIFSKDEKNELIYKINEFKESINKIDKIKNDIIKELEKYKENNLILIKFIEDLLGTYEYEDKNNNMNYNVIQNLKNIQNHYSNNKFHILEKIIEKSQKFITFIQNIQNSKEMNSLKCKKIIKSHSKSVNHISILQDGRLASCSSDNSFIIYDIKTFEPQITCNLHSSGIFSFTQLEDGRIITCSEDKTMKMIKVDNEKYTIEQTLQGHNGKVVKIIEFNKNELISISNDNSMKFWNINKENRNFTCIKSVTFQNSENYCIGILKIKENEFVTVSNGDNTIKFWNYTNYSLIKEIKGINPDFTYHQICLINENILCVCNYDELGLILFNINSRELIKKITGLQNIYAFIECMDGNFLCTAKEKNDFKIIKFKYENNDLKKISEINQASTNLIYDVIELYDGSIVSCGYDNLIKIWS